MSQLVSTVLCHAFLITHPALLSLQLASLSRLSDFIKFIENATLLVATLAYIPRLTRKRSVIFEQYSDHESYNY